MLGTLIAVGLGVVQATDAFLPSRDFVLTKSGAVGLLPPISVCDYIPERVAWSDDGNRLLIIRKDPKLSETQLLQNLNPGQGQRSVVIFDMKSRTSREVLSFPESQGTVADTAWFGNDRSFFLVTRTGTKDSPAEEVRCWLYVGGAATNHANLVYTGQPGDYISFCPSPTSDLGAMLVSRTSISAFSSWGKFVFANGSMGTNIEAPENAVFRLREEAYWSTDGTVAVLTFFSRPATLTLQPIDVSTGRRTSPPNSRYNKEAREDEFVVWEIKEKLEAEELSVERNSLWLASLTRSSKSKSLIVGDGRKATISPAKNAIFYISGGIGVVRPLVTVSREEFVRLLSSEEKNRLTTELQECIKVFKEWVLEENMEFPTPEEWVPKAKAWSMSRPQIVGFVYTFKGGQIPAGKQAQTVFGYKQGETGRATCYMDGRVVWKPN